MKNNRGKPQDSFFRLIIDLSPRKKDKKDGTKDEN